MHEELINQNIKLRPITEEDTSNIIRWRNSDLVKPFFIYQSKITEEDHKRWLEQKVSTGIVVQFIISDIQSGKDIGTVYLQNIDRTNKKAEFGIFIGEEAALGKGLGRLAAEKIVEYAFETLDLEKVYLRVLASNERAHRSYSKAGFVDEGCFRKDVWIDGKPVDVIFMAKLKNQ